MAMKLTGHKTEVYRRHPIVNDSDLRAAAVKVAESSEGTSGGRAQLSVVNGQQ